MKYRKNEYEKNIFETLLAMRKDKMKIFYQKLFKKLDLKLISFSVVL